MFDLTKKENAEAFNQLVNDIELDVRMEVDLSAAVASIVSDILEQRNMTQKELAHKLGKRESEVCKWLGGGHNFTIRTLAKIGAALDVSLVKANGDLLSDDMRFDNPEVFYSTETEVDNQPIFVKFNPDNSLKGGFNFSHETRKNVPMSTPSKPSALKQTA